MMKCNLDIRLGIAPVLLPILLSGEISLVKAFAIQLVFNTKLNQKDSSHSFLSKSAQLGDVGNVGSKLSNISYSRLQLDLSPSK